MSQPLRLVPLLTLALAVAAGCQAPTPTIVADGTSASTLRMAAAAEEDVFVPEIEVAMPPGLDPLILAEADDPRSRWELPRTLRHMSTKVELPTLPPEVASLPEPDADTRREALRHYVRGRTAALEGNRLRAEHELTQARHLAPKHRQILREIASLHLENRDLRAAKPYLERMLALDPEDPEALLILGLAAADRRQFERATGLLGRLWLRPTILMHDPAEQVVAAYVLAESLRHLGYDLASIQAGLTAVEVSPKMAVGTRYGARLAIIYRQRAELWQAIGDAYCRLGEPRLALNSYYRASSLSMSDPGALAPRVIYANLRLGRVKSAHAALLAGLEPPVADREIRLCRYLAERGDATDLLASAVLDLYESNPEEPGLARAAATLLPSDDALDLLRKFVSRKPRDVTAVLQLLTWLGEHDVDAAVDLTMSLVEDHPDLAAEYVKRLATALPRPMAAIESVRTRRRTPITVNVETRLLAGFGSLGRAWTACQEGLRQWPDDPSLQMLQIDIAGLLAEPHLLDKALADAESIDTAWSWSMRALALRATQQPIQAVEAAQKAVSLDPNGLEPLVVLGQSLLALAGESGDQAEILRLAEDAANTGERAMTVAPDRDEAYIVPIQLYRRIGYLSNPDELRRVMGKLGQANPESRLLDRTEAQFDFASGRYERTLQKSLGLYESDPTDTEALALAVRAWSSAKRLDDAQQWVKRQRERRPGDPILLEHWARLRMQLGRPDEVIELLSDTLRREPENGAALRLLRSALDDQERHDEAIEIGERYLLARPIGVRRQLALGALYARADRDTQTISSLKWIVDHADGAGVDLLISSLAIASNLEELPGRDQLILDLTLATVDQHPATPLTVYGAGLVALARLEPFDEAGFDTLVRRALADAPSAAEANQVSAARWRKVGQMLVDADKPEAAARAMRARLYAVAPMEVQALSDLVFAVLAADAAAGGQVTKSISLLIDLETRGEQLAIVPDRPLTLVDVLHEASIMYTFTGDHDGSAVLLEAIIERDEADAMAMNNLGYQRLEAGDRSDDTRDLILRAQELEGADANILDTVGWLRYKQSDPSAAITLIEQAIESTDEPSGEVYDHLGDALFRVGARDKALTAWRQSITRLSDAGRREEVLRNLMGRQQQIWGLLVADPRELYHRDYETRLEQVREKVRALESGETPTLAPTFAELN
jgi:tetratricopeptide (TPR) repeat protein